MVVRALLDSIINESLVHDSGSAMEIASKGITLYYKWKSLIELL